eukprot:4201649-Alexandrium_andersonii.AAC.1
MTCSTRRGGADATAKTGAEAAGSGRALQQQMLCSRAVQHVINMLVPHRREHALRGCKCRRGLFRPRSMLSGQRICDDTRNAWGVPEPGDAIQLQGTAQR